MPTDLVTFPPGPPTVSGNTMTVDTLLANPQYVSRRIADLALQKFMVDKMFAPAGQVTGGATIYEQATANDLYATRDVQRIEPLREYPIITFDRPVPLTAQVEKFGGKFPVSDEARVRNRINRVNVALIKLANTIRRKTQQRALTELAAAITANSRTAAGVNWTTAAGVAYLSQAPSAQPGADFARVAAKSDLDELGYEYDMVILNPANFQQLATIFDGQNGRPTVNSVLASFGINQIWVTNRKAVNSAYFVAQQMVGEIGYELVPPSEGRGDGMTEVWRDKDGKDADWIQSRVKPIVYVTDPFAILEVTGIG